MNIYNQNCGDRSGNIISFLLVVSFIAKLHFYQNFASLPNGKHIHEAYNEICLES